jgi:hypothetical protein
MQYMVIEKFKSGCLTRVYERYREKGRMLPNGLQYIDSWIAEDKSKCFQLMKTEEATLLEAWQRRWDDLVEFEIVPVCDSPTKAAKKSVNRQL